MRYWGYLVAKLAAAGAVLWGLLALVNRLLPKAREFETPTEKAKLLGPLENAGAALLNNTIFMLWFLLAAVVLYFIIRDQRYRCRVCLRRMRMPIEMGSWGGALISGRPLTEYICPYGHGTLTAEEVQISGLQPPEWKPQSGDIWEELSASIVKDDHR